MIEGNYDATFTLANLKKDITTMTKTAKDLENRLANIKEAEEIYKNEDDKEMVEMASDNYRNQEYIKKSTNNNNL